MESFFANHQYTFSAIGAIGSMAAVIISLWYSYAAHSQNTKVRVKCTLKYYADIDQILTNSNTSHYLIQLDVVNNSFFGIKINIGCGMRYGRGKKYLQMFPVAFSSTLPEYQLTGNTIALERYECKNIVFAYDDSLVNLVKNFHNTIIESNNILAECNRFGRFGNKLYIELTDGTKIKIDNRIPKNVPNK